MSACFAILSFLSTALHALLLMMLLGIFQAFFNINIFTLPQITIPTEIRGRIFGLLGTLTSGLTPISMGLAGIVADLLNQNIPLLYAICGFTTVILSITISFNQDFKSFLRSEDLDDNPVIEFERA